MVGKLTFPVETVSIFFPISSFTKAPPPSSEGCLLPTTGQSPCSEPFSE